MLLIFRMCWTGQARRSIGGMAHPGERAAFSSFRARNTRARQLPGWAATAPRFRNDSGKRMYPVTARRMISGEVLK